MTNSFIDFLKLEFQVGGSIEAWDAFLESNYAKQIEVIELYAQDAFDAGQAGMDIKDEDGKIAHSKWYSSFNQWKNEQQ